MRIAFHHVALITGLGLAGGGAPDAGAQSDRHQQQCEKARKIVERGKPDRKEEWAWSTVPGCGAGGGLAARDAWLLARTEADPARLEKLYSRLWSFRDASLFEAARTIATDPSASAPSRVYSGMMLVVQLLDREDPNYDWFTKAGAGGVCRIGSVDDRVVRTGQPLPPDARQLGLRVGQHLASDASAPAIVRSAGRCLTQAIQVDDEIRASGPIKPPASAAIDRPQRSRSRPAWITTVFTWHGPCSTATLLACHAR